MKRVVLLFTLLLVSCTVEKTDLQWKTERSIMDGYHCVYGSTTKHMPNDCSICKKDGVVVINAPPQAQMCYSRNDWEPYLIK